MQRERTAGKVWVLDTQTKGTGATMVPLDRVLRKPGTDQVPGFVLPDLKPPGESPVEAPRPLEFKVMNVMTREVLAERADARATVRALEDVRQIVDVAVSVWEPEPRRWRKLTFSELSALWDYRGRTDESHRGEPTDTDAGGDTSSSSPASS